MSKLSKTLIAIGLVLVCLIQLLPFYVALTTSLKPKTDLSSQLLPPVGAVLRQLRKRARRRQHPPSHWQQHPRHRDLDSPRLRVRCSRGLSACAPQVLGQQARDAPDPQHDHGATAEHPGAAVLDAELSRGNQHVLGHHPGDGDDAPVAERVSLRAFLRTIPSSLEEAAKLDGANLFQTLFYIVFPLLKPVTATVVILTGIATWNEYALSAFILTKPDVQTIAPAIASFFSTQSSNLGAAAAASLLALVPVLVAYLFLQQWFMKGMVAGAEK